MNFLKFAVDKSFILGFLYMDEDGLFESKNMAKKMKQASNILFFFFFFPGKILDINLMIYHCYASSWFSHPIYHWHQHNGKY